MKYIILGLSFILTCVGAIMKDVTDLETLSIAIIVWGIIADFGVFVFWHREEDW